MEADADYLVRRISPHESLDDLIDFPRFFEIETVNACQAKCPMCTIANWERRDGVMNEDLFEKIAQELEDHADKVRRVHLYRDGEPLLDKKLVWRVARLKCAGIGEVGISTNVELLTPDKTVALIHAGLSELILSVDSLIKNVYERIRVGLDFDKVITNAKAALAINQAMGSPCRIRVRMIRQEANFAEWESGKYQAFWLPLIGPRDTIEERALHNWGGQLDGFKTQGDTQRPCIALWSLMCIFADGSVPLCNADYNAKHPLGSVRTHSIAELWQSHEQNRRRKIHWHGLRAAIPMCTNCTVWSERAAA